MNKKLYNKLGKEEINQTREKNGSASPIGSASPRSRQKRPLLAFRDSAIERIKKIDIAFGTSRFKEFKFDVSSRKKIKLIFAEKNALGEIFYRNNFAKGNWIYFPRINQEKTYKNLNKQQMIVFTRTTLGYEGLAKGLKCAVFYPYFPEKSIHTIYPRSGPFWTNLQKYEDREKVLKRVIGFSNKSWKKIASKYSVDIMSYDPSNIKKKKIIKMALKF